MHEHLQSRTLPATSNAAEGPPWRRFSVAEIEAMVEAGVIDRGERFELIGGEIVPMSPQGDRHEVIRSALTRNLGKRLPEPVLFNIATTFRLSEDTFIEPDVVFYTRETGLKGLNPATCLLAMDVADTGLACDTGRKANIQSTIRPD
jgi:Uma2 family endonuclease